MKSITGVPIFIINAILALAAAAGELTQPPVTESLHTFNVSQNASDALETITREHKGNPDLPRVLEVRQSCYEGGHSYCMNGNCTYHVDQDQMKRHRTCVCNSGYEGERCEQLVILSSHTVQQSEQYFYITIGIGIGLLFSGIIVLLYHFCQKRCKKSKAVYSKCSVAARV
ncbi:epigen-like [Mustelus asterias]